MGADEPRGAGLWSGVVGALPVRAEESSRADFGGEIEPPTGAGETCRDRNSSKAELLIPFKFSSVQFNVIQLNLHSV